MFVPFPFIMMSTIAASVFLERNAASNGSIFGNLACITLTATPRAPWHFLQFASYRGAPSAGSARGALATTVTGGSGAAGLVAGCAAGCAAGTGAAAGFVAADAGAVTGAAAALVVVTVALDGTAALPAWATTADSATAGVGATAGDESTGGTAAAVSDAAGLSLPQAARQTAAVRANWRALFIETPCSVIRREETAFSWTIARRVTRVRPRSCPRGTGES